MQNLNLSKFRMFEVNHYDLPLQVEVSPVDENHVINKRDINKIVDICNQPAIYSFLFAKRLKNQPYREDSADGFIKWAKEGWRNGQYFVFLVKNQLNEIIGAIDIKSNNPNGAEIGYWMDQNFPGYMSNIVKGLVERAKEVGFKKLIAFTQPENARSQRVLIRAGFTHLGIEDHKDEDGEVHEKFEIILAN